MPQGPWLLRRYLITGSQLGAAVVAEPGFLGDHRTALGTMTLQHRGSFFFGRFFGSGGGLQFLHLLLQGLDVAVGGGNAFAQSQDLGIGHRTGQVLGPQQVADLTLELLDTVVFALDLLVELADFDRGVGRLLGGLGRRADFIKKSHMCTSLTRVVTYILNVLIV